MKKSVGSKRAFSRNKLAIWLALLSALLYLSIPMISHAGNITQSGQVQVTAKVTGPPPSVPAVITSPASGQVITNIPVEVIGTCSEPGLVIEIFDNGSFIGSAMCQNDGTFTVSVDLTKGKNDLVAEEFDALDQQGPNSTVVSVTYAPPVVPVNVSQAATPASSSPSQLSITFDSTYNGYSGCTPGQQLSLPLLVRGGTPPYAVNIDWGDGTNKLVSLPNGSEPLIAGHIYNQAGTYKVNMSASDSGGQHAVLNIVVVINGQPKPAVVGITNTTPYNWYAPTYYQWMALLLLPLGFMLGKINDHRHETSQTTHA